VKILYINDGFVGPNHVFHWLMNVIKGLSW